MPKFILTRYETTDPTYEVEAETLEEAIEALMVYDQTRFERTDDGEYFVSEDLRVLCDTVEGPGSEWLTPEQVDSEHQPVTKK